MIKKKILITTYKMTNLILKKKLLKINIKTINPTILQTIKIKLFKIIKVEMKILIMIYKKIKSKIS